MINYRPLGKELDKFKSYTPPEHPLAFAKDWDFIPVASREGGQFAGWHPLVIRQFNGRLQLGMPVKTDRAPSIMVTSDKGRWLGKKIPFFLRSYPYALRKPALDATHRLFCVADDAEGFVERSEDSFQAKNIILDGQGELTEFGQKMQKRLTRFENTYEADAESLQILQQAGALIPWQPDFSKVAQGFNMPTEGLMRVDESKLSQLPDEAVLRLHQLDGFKLVYIHILSLLRLGVLGHFENMMQSKAPQMDEDLVSQLFDDEDDLSFNF